MDPSYLAVLLLFVGLALVVAEVFLPSGGILSAGALLVLAGSAIFAWNAWWGTSPFAWWFYVGSTTLLIPAVIAAALWALPHTRLGHRFLLDPPTSEELHAYGNQEEQLGRLVGSFGKTVSPLNPGGLVLVEGERLHCRSEGMLVDADQPVKVIAVAGNVVVVRPVKESELQQASDDASAVDDFLPDEDPPRDSEFESGSESESGERSA